MKYLIMLISVAILLLIVTVYMSKHNKDQTEAMAPVLKECKKDRYDNNGERDIYIRWPYIEYEPDCKWKRFDSLRY
jgi:hypothetical protein